MEFDGVLDGRTEVGRNRRDPLDRLRRKDDLVLHLARL
jgi:hypothetical protein